MSLRLAVEWLTIKAAKRKDPSNSITKAFMNLETGIKASSYDLVPASEADIVFVFGSITQRKMDTERAIAIDKHRKAGKHIVALDSGFFSTYMRESNKTSETDFFRVLYGDCTGEGTLLATNSDDARLKWFQKTFNFKIKEPKADISTILFIGQSMKGWQYDLMEPYHEWALKQLRAIREKTDRQIIYRIHPTDGGEIRALVNHIDNLKMTIGTRQRVGILQDMQNCSTSITHSSSAALESLVEGLHTISLDPRCVVHDACAHSLEDRMPWELRQQKLNDYAYSTWHISEMTNPALIEYWIGQINNMRIK